MNNDRKSNYEVGYGKPPQHTKFVRGQIGNPKGRPKGSKNFKTLLLAELMTVLAIVENGKRKKITKQGAFIKQLVNKAAAGDPRAMVALLNEIRHLEAGSDDAARPHPLTSWNLGGQEARAYNFPFVAEGLMPAAATRKGRRVNPLLHRSCTTLFC